MFGIKISALNNFLSDVSKNSQVFAPVKVNNVTEFGLFDSESIVDLNTIKTKNSPKKLFFTPYENISSFRSEGKNFIVENIEECNEDFVVFGVRACDESALKILDKVFMTDPTDTFYASKRNHGIIISIACNKFDESCFCTNFGISPDSPSGDISAIICGDYIIFEPKTQKGKDFITKYQNLSDLSVVNDDDFAITVSKERERIKNISEFMPVGKLDLEKFNKNDLLTIFNHEKWKELSATCLGCASCTFICPTCQCYDIRDIKEYDSIKRVRCWDSCMYKDFTLVAGGGNPRKTQMERFRQRFMHKLVYFPKNNDNVFGCVGCGRCLKSCPNNLNIVNVIKQLKF